MIPNLTTTAVDVDKVALKVTLKDGTVFERADIEQWAKGDFSSIGLDRRYPGIVRELAQLVLKLADG